MVGTHWEETETEKLRHLGRIWKALIKIQLFRVVTLGWLSRDEGLWYSNTKMASTANSIQKQLSVPGQFRGKLHVPDGECGTYAAATVF